MIFPARVGMNRNGGAVALLLPHFPRASGDEPSQRHHTGDRLRIFPARVGMNRLPSPGYWPRRDFPRASGDEPALVSVLSTASEFSPREWG